MAMNPLYPRARIDIEPAALVRALGYTARPPRNAVRSLEDHVSPAGEVIATLSARSGFDALLTALALAPGDEVLLSGWTIPDMARVVRGHGLVPVPLDCEPGTLAPSLETLDAAITTRSRVLVMAQLFGARAPLDAFAERAHRAGMVVVDDDAQGYTGAHRLEGSACADVVLHSFGSIKTATALGGGLVRVRDTVLRSRMREVIAAWPAQSTRRYARKLATYLALVVPRDPWRYRGFERTLAVAGRDVDAVVTGVTKGFPAETPEALLHAIRARPCDALCATLHAQLMVERTERIARRRAAGEHMIAALGGRVPVLGSAMPDRTHWLFAVRVAAPDALVRTLRAAGFDAARGTSTIAAVETAVERPSLRAAQCESWRAEVVFLPVYPEIPDAERDRMASLVAGW